MVLNIEIIIYFPNSGRPGTHAIINNCDLFSDSGTQSKEYYQVFSITYKAEINRTEK